MLRASLLVVCFTMVPFASLECDEPKPNGERDKKARELVRQLGDPVFRKRDAAAQELVAMGTESLPALQAAVNDQDAEIRERSKQLLKQLEDLEFKQRIREFREDKTGAKNISLPGWKRFSQLVGNEESSREFFAEMFSENVDLMQHMENDPKKTADIIIERCNLFLTAEQTKILLRRCNSNSIKPPTSLRNFTALILVYTHPTINEFVNSTNCDPFMINLFLLCNPCINTFSNNEESGLFLKKLYLGVLDELFNSYMNPPKVKQIRLSEFIPHILLKLGDSNIELAEEFLKKVAFHENSSAFLRARAVLILGKFRDPRNIRTLAPLLRDKTLVSTILTGKGQDHEVSVEIRDVALGVSIYLAGKNLEEYEFYNIKNHLDFTEELNPTYLGFETDEHRKAAFKKWDEFVAKKAKEGEKK